MTSLVQAFYHLKMAQEYFADTARSCEIGSPLQILCKGYEKKSAFPFQHFKTTPSMIGIDLSALDNELKSDIMFHGEISSLCLRLNEEQKAGVVDLLKSLLAGEKVTVVLQDETEKK